MCSAALTTPRPHFTSPWRRRQKMNGSQNSLGCSRQEIVVVVCVCVCVCVSVCVGKHVCMRDRVSERESECVRGGGWICVCVCVCVCVHTCACVSEGSRVEGHRCLAAGAKNKLS